MLVGIGVIVSQPLGIVPDPVIHVNLRWSIYSDQRDFLSVVESLLVSSHLFLPIMAAPPEVTSKNLSGTYVMVRVLRSVRY